MTTGHIDQGGHPVLPVDLFDRQGRLRRVEAMLDTGFDDFLALPSHWVQRLGLVWAARMPMRVATSEWALFDVYEATVWWFGARLPIRVLQTQSEILVGTRLLWESQLAVQFWEGGVVSVQSRPE
ncbi:MAG: clan AA aspartic protease [Chloroflexota bacterium]|nr:clan AA aspartic protease [Chloroflexota bacterium]MDE2959067.1 clan AA aspartic protease [Chloroflexota bacterium]